MKTNWELSTNKSYGERPLGELIDDHSTKDAERDRVRDKFTMGKFKCF